MSVDRARVFGQEDSAVERIAPGFFPEGLEAEHLTRYKWAGRWVRAARVLDVACGTGYGADILRAAGARQVISLDASWDALGFGRERFKLQSVQGDAQSLPFQARTFDVVVSFETIEHLRGPTEFLAEVSRVLRSGGSLLISTPNAAASNGLNPYHIHEFVLDELLFHLAQAGFGVRSVFGQRWRMLPQLFVSGWGFRRIRWEIERRPDVTRLRLPRSVPRYWCVYAISNAA